MRCLENSISQGLRKKFQKYIKLNHLKQIFWISQKVAVLFPSKLRVKKIYKMIHNLLNFLKKSVMGKLKFIITLLTPKNRKVQKQDQN